MSDLIQGGGNLRARWAAGDVTFGGWCSIGDPFVAELMGRAGFDWLCLDMQHGLIGPDGIVSMLQATDAAGVPALIRVPDTTTAWIGRALDAGAEGVIVPMIETAEQALDVVMATHYAPVGRRSWGPTRAAIREATYDPTEVNARILTILMIETRAGVENVERIMATPGIDAIFVGPADLALSEGRHPTRSGPVTGESIDTVIDAGRRHAVPVGIFCQDMAEVERFAQRGLSMIAVMSDVRLLRRAIADSLVSARTLPLPMANIGSAQAGPL